MLIQRQTVKTLYRLFIVLEGSQFIFSRSKRPVIDSTQMTVQQKKVLDPFSAEVNKPSKNMGTPTLKTNGYDSRNRPNIFVPSMYVYTARDGNIHLNLPDANSRSSVKFYDENDNFLFEIKNLKETALTLDKTNFTHAGWFKFELYNEEKLVEKNKFYLAREF